MQLTAERFEELLKGAGGQKSGRKPERRNSVRLGVRYSVTVRPLFAGSRVAGEPFRAWLRDVSLVGVGLTAPAAMSGKFTLELPNANDAVRSVPCAVKTSRKLPDGQFQIGAVFEE
jgi:hypothetical protein